MNQPRDDVPTDGDAPGRDAPPEEMPGGDEVEAAVAGLTDALNEAYGRMDRDAYFSFFAPDSTFALYDQHEVLVGREAYEMVWDDWIAHGDVATSCRSTDRQIVALGPNAAVLTHRVVTTYRDAPEEWAERETIVFHRREGSWLAVHEHLSPESATDEDTPAS